VSDTSRRLRDRVERRALTALTAATVAVLVVVFYYPVGTVLVEAVVVDGRLTLAVFADLLRDPFYLGEFARLFTGEGPVAVARAVAAPDRRLGIVGFTAYQAVLSTIVSVALGLPAAYVLARFEFPGRRTLRSVTILPFVLPSIMVAVGFVATFGRNGTLNAVLSAIGGPRVDLMFSLEAILIAHAFYSGLGVGRRERGRDRPKPRCGTAAGLPRRRRPATLPGGVDERRAHVRLYVRHVPNRVGARRVRAGDRRGVRLPART